MRQFLLQRGSAETRLNAAPQVTPTTLMGPLVYSPRLTLFSGVFEVGDFVIGSHSHYLPAFFLELSYITVAQFRTPFESWGVIAFYVVERPMGVKSRHILAELGNMAFHDYAGRGLGRCCIAFWRFWLGSLRVREG